MKILVDMNLSILWVDVLKSAGHEAVHWSSVGLAESPDEDIVTYAESKAFTIMTRDLDFGGYMAISRRRQPSIVQIRARRGTPDLHKKIVLDALEQTREVLDEGALVTIDADRVRVRLLPFSISSIEPVRE